jgi:hypothetical protein|tara:strand:+ start:11919 stop:12119 length:201 start_codon:yes stop_codon:yes gene_type:complete
MTSVDDYANDKSFENEQSTVTIPLKEYDRLREKQKYITDKDMIAVVDKIEELVRALRKHIVRAEID